MAWNISAVGTPAVLVAQVNALVAASSAETASLARAKTAINAELNSYAAGQTLNLNASGNLNADGDAIHMTIQPFQVFGGLSPVGNFPTPP